MQNSWRSWFWNLVLMVVMLGMAAISTGVAIQEAGSERMLSAVGFGIAALLCWAATVRSLMLGVFARPYGIVMRGLGRTVTIPWSQVVKITDDALTSGAAGMGGATTPMVVRRRPGKPQDQVELNVLGGYGVSRRRPSLADRAIKGLNGHFATWRKTNRT